MQVRVQVQEHIQIAHTAASCLEFALRLCSYQNWHAASGSQKGSRRHTPAGALAGDLARSWMADGSAVQRSTPHGMCVIYNNIQYAICHVICHWPLMSYYILYIMPYAGRNPDLCPIQTDLAAIC
jgi:hypothetical protein